MTKHLGFQSVDVVDRISLPLGGASLRPGGPVMRWLVSISLRGSSSVRLLRHRLTGLYFGRLQRSTPRSGLRVRPSVG
jgi:hypothetical protein